MTCRVLPWVCHPLGLSSQDITECPGAGAVPACSMKLSVPCHTSMLMEGILQGWAPGASLPQTWVGVGVCGCVTGCGCVGVCMCACTCVHGVALEPGPCDFEGPSAMSMQTPVSDPSPFWPFPAKTQASCVRMSSQGHFTQFALGRTGALLRARVLMTHPQNSKGSLLY